VAELVDGAGLSEYSSPVGVVEESHQIPREFAVQCQPGPAGQRPCPGTRFGSVSAAAGQSGHDPDDDSGDQRDGDGDRQLDAGPAVVLTGPQAVATLAA
jgi:hypothetical protein